MYKVDQVESNAEIIYPEQPLKEPLAVTEIGQAHHCAGFTTETVRKNNFILQCVFSGSCTYNDTSVKAPALIYVAPNAPVRYEVDKSCNDFHICWIKFGGDMADNLIRSLGFGKVNEIIPLTRPEKARTEFSALLSEATYADVDDSLFMLSGLYKLLAIFSANISKRETRSISSYTQTLLNYIHEKYSSRISEKDMASIINLSTNYMHKIFLTDMQTTPINYLNYYRIECAKKLLRDTNYSISKIADLVGISGGDYFCRVFRKYDGDTSPTTFRKLAKMKIIENN